MARRTSIYVEGYGHKNPIPAAARIGGFVASGIIYGLDTATGKPAPTLDAQCTLMFQHLRRIIEEQARHLANVVLGEAASYQGYEA